MRHEPKLLELKGLGTGLFVSLFGSHWCGWVSVERTQFSARAAHTYQREEFTIYIYMHTPVCLNAYDTPLVFLSQYILHTICIFRVCYMYLLINMYRITYGM